MILRGLTRLRRSGCYTPRLLSKFSTTPSSLSSSGVDGHSTSPFNFVKDADRAQDECDVCIVGAGPAGLSAAIKLKQLNENLRVVILEKGAEVGSHILSGAVIEPKALDELLPNWKQLGAPLNQPATNDSMKFLTKNYALPIPHPPQMSNHGNYIISLSRLTAWLAEKAEELGVEIYPGFAAAGLNWVDGKVGGVVTNEIGVGKSGEPTDHFEPGMVFNAKATLLSEGAHGSISQKVINHFKLREGKDEQTYGIGIKEVWRVDPSKHQAGNITHTVGWPIDNETYAGSWCYHMEDNLVSIGLVIGLDYHNPYLSPFREFQRMKHHPVFKDLLDGGECIAYGGRSLNEGGLQSIPQLHFPGGALIGCSAGFVNVPKIKGVHNAMKSGMLAAETVHESISNEKDQEVEFQPASVDMAGYEDKVKNSWIWKELHEVRNIRPSFHSVLGNLGGLIYSGIDSLLLKGRTPWTFHHPGPDYAQTRPKHDYKPIEYPNPDGKISFDILTSVSRTSTNHEEDEPSHLKLTTSPKYHTAQNVGVYGGLLGRACPAAVYEYRDTAEDGGEEDALGHKFVINSQNCIHCKLCSIKTPTQDITWTTPQGGGGPKYSIT
ncbi:hypothetical protein E3P77_01700 [Wallemia ichthyophaga]|nr:hypothetical protein E3P77_01700 [Wallemia ichthyophaga]